MTWPDLFRFNLPLFAQEQLHFHPDLEQLRFLQHEHHHTLLNCTRQWGKSSLAAILATHKLLYGHPETLIVIAGPTQRQSSELLRKVRRCHDLRVPFTGDGDNAESAQIANGSRVVGLPGVGDNIRCFSSVDLLLLDEAARIPDETWLAVHPLIARSQGPVIAMSTPAGPAGFFWEAWTQGGAEWLRIQVPATRCPRFPPPILERERRVLGDFWFRQEFLCEFSNNGDGFFAQADLAHLLDKVPA
ncbi:MAG: terminase large subunit domain-containing protein [Bryobacteraceae bacterium]